MAPHRILILAASLLGFVFLIYAMAAIGQLPASSRAPLLLESAAAPTQALLHLTNTAAEPARDLVLEAQEIVEPPHDSSIAPMSAEAPIGKPSRKSGRSEENEPARMIVDAMIRNGLDVVGQSMFGDSSLTGEGSNAEEVDHRTMLIDAVARQQQAAEAQTSDSQPSHVQAAPSHPSWHTWRQISRQLDQSAELLEDLGSFEQADALRSIAAHLRQDAREAENDSRQAVHPGTIISR